MMSTFLAFIFALTLFCTVAILSSTKGRMHRNEQYFMCLLPVFTLALLLIDLFAYGNYYILGVVGIGMIFYLFRYMKVVAKYRTPIK